jgi:hypothetical protein
MKATRFLSWENFRSTVFLHGQQRVHRVSDSPFVEIFGDGEKNQIGIWIETAPGTTIAPELASLAFIRIQTLTRDGRFLLEVTTSAATLQRQFYHFAVAVAERVVGDNKSAIDAVALELRCFTDLLEEKTLLGIERQIGLIGELIFLERLIGKGGPGALDSWLGPSGEPHDFRLQAREFEVKTTVSTHRIHTIHGTEQLVPSQGCTLYLISVLLGPPGASAGFSLPDKAAQVAALIESDATRLQQLISSLESSGYRESESRQYTRKFAMRRPMGLVQVDKSFPAITRPVIQTALGGLAARIESLQYDVNIDGLEVEDGTTRFEAAVSN